MYFAQKADVVGHNDVAAVFRSTAEGETGHAHGHLEFLEEVGDLHVVQERLIVLVLYPAMAGRFVGDNVFVHIIN